MTFFHPEVQRENTYLCVFEVKQKSGNFTNKSIHKRMKNRISILHYFAVAVMLCSLFNSTAQTTFEAKDLNGLWKATKPGAEITIEINNNSGIIISVAGTKIPNELIYGVLYQDIRFENNTWKATRNKWIYPGVNGQNSEQGRWETGDELTITLAENKKSFQASGHWTFNRVEEKTNGFIVNTEEKGKKTVIEEDFGAVKMKFTLATLQSGKDLIIAQMNNTSATKRAIILLKSDQSSFTKYVLEPSQGMNTNFEGLSVDIQIVYEESDLPNNSGGIIDFVKDKVRKQVTKERGELKSTVIGIRG